MFHQFSLFLHVVGTAVLGYYLILPLLVMRTKRFEGESLEAYIENLYKSSMVMQYALILQLLTGGYLMIAGDYAVMWIILVLVFFLLIGALSGIMNKNMKSALGLISAGEQAEHPLGTARSISVLVSLSMLVILYIMMYPIH